MNKEDIWNLFKNTGDINYFLKYKKMIEEGIDFLESRKSNRDNS